MTLPNLATTKPTSSSRSLRICVVTSELSELFQNGGMGTATSALIDLLSRDGHRVTILYLGEANTNQLRCSETLEARGIRIVIPNRAKDPGPRAVSYSVYDWLRREQAYEIIHFNDYDGTGFYTLQARRLGLAFQQTLMCTTVHGPTRWALEADERPLERVRELESDHLEMRQIELSDVVLSPSERILCWLRSRGVTLPQSTFLSRYPLRFPKDEYADRHLKAGELSEVIFFGRHEVRKGFKLFVESIRLISPVLPKVSVTFLGRFGTIECEHSAAYALARFADARLHVQFLNNHDRDEALEYIKRPNSLLVVPSRDDNSPCVVQEALHMKLPFIAAATGGIPELISAKSHARVLFPYNVEALSKKILDVHRRGLRSAKPSYSLAAARAGISAWHRRVPVQHPCVLSKVRAAAKPQPRVSVCVTHRNRSKYLKEALTSLWTQCCLDFEIIVVDDGSTESIDLRYLDSLESQIHPVPTSVLRIPHSYLGAARNCGAAAARGEFLMFMDDDNIATEREIATFLDAASHTRASILTSFSYEFDDMETPKAEMSAIIEFPIGQAGTLGLFGNYFGDANALIRRDVFERLGGFSEVIGVGFEDYEFFARAELAGEIIAVIPEPLFFYRVTPGSMLSTTSVYENHKRALRAYLENCKLVSPIAIEFLNDLHLGHVLRARARGRVNRYTFSDIHRELQRAEPNSDEALRLVSELLIRTRDVGGLCGPQRREVRENGRGDCRGKGGRRVHRIGK